MEIKRKTSGNTITLKLIGRLDTLTSVQLANELKSIQDAGQVNLLFDFTALEYVSSAGLRILLTAQKAANALGTELEIIGVNETVREVFEVTGFSGILKIS